MIKKYRILKKINCERLRKRQLGGLVTDQCPRTGKSRDSGIQYNMTGPLKVWPRIMEFQINQGGTGDIWVVKGTGMSITTASCTS